MSAAPPQRPILKRRGFQLEGRDFSVQGISRVEGRRLRELLHPESLRLKRDQKAAAEEARNLFRKPFFVAQLRYYGISFPASSTAGQLEIQLRDAVEQGKCDVVPEVVVSLESKMRLDHEAAVGQWEEAERAWHDEQKRAKDEEFRKAETPGQKAACDLTRFMDHYFLTDGKPDPSKTTEPLVLHGFGNRWTLHSLADKVPGLETCSGGEGTARTLCIGWDRREVFDAAARITRLAQDAQKEARRVVWEKAMEEHREFVSQAGRGKKGGKPKAKPFDLAACAGSYIIQCETIEDGWPIETTDLYTLDIMKASGRGTIVSAAVDLGVFEGTILLSLSRQALVDVVGEEALDSEADPDEDEDDDGEEEEEEDASAVSRKRQASSSTPADAQPKKKARTTEDAKPPRRVELVVRGRETGEGEICADPGSGRIDFLDDECFTFKGVVDYLPHIADNVEMRGYKVSALPQRQPESWDSFSWGAYETARVGRWF